MYIISQARSRHQSPDEKQLDYKQKLAVNVLRHKFEIFQSGYIKDWRERNSTTLTEKNFLIPSVWVSRK